MRQNANASFINLSILRLCFQNMHSNVSFIIFMNYNMLIFIDLNLSSEKWVVVLIARIPAKWTEISSRVPWIM